MGTYGVAVGGAGPCLGWVERAGWVVGMQGLGFPRLGPACALYGFLATRGTKGFMPDNCGPSSAGRNC